MKQHIRKITALFGTALLALGALTGCGTPAQDDGRLTVVTTVYASYDLAKQLTAEFSTPAEVKLLLTPGGESHSYEPTPSDTAAIQSCDLFVYIGGTSEKWAEKMIASSRADKENLRLFDTVTLLGEEESESMQAEEEEEEDEFDEHIWTAPMNADKMADAMRKAIRALLPEESAKCDAAYDALHKELTALDTEAKEIRENAKTDTLIFADRFPFRYFTDAYGWKYDAAFSGGSSDTDASAATLSALITKVKDQNIGTVFYLENSSQKVSDAVCEATGAKAVMLQSCNNVSREDFDSGKHYQDFMHENLDAIREAVS